MMNLLVAATTLALNIANAVEMEPVFPKQFNSENEKFFWKQTEGRFYSYRVCMSVQDIPTCAARFPQEFANISRQNALKGIIANNTPACGNGSKAACEQSIKAAEELNKLIQEYPRVRGK